MPPTPGTRTAPPQGYLHPDPAAVSAWCRARLTANAVYVAPSAASRRFALRSLATNGATTLGVAFTSRANLVAHLETRAGLAPLRAVAPSLERLLLGDAARAAKLPLFEDGHAPRGAIDSLSRLARDLRFNAVSPDKYTDAGGDSRAADACRRYEARRAELGLADEADRVTRLITHGIPGLAIVVEEPAINDCLTLDLYRAIAADAASLHVGISDLGGDRGPASLVGRLREIDIDVASAGDPATTPPMSAIGGAGMYDEIELVARRILALLRSGNAVRPSDVLAVAPSSQYLGLLHDALATLGIPVASPRRVPALDVPLVSALLSAFRMLAVAEDDKAETGLALLTSSYTGLTLPRADRIARSLIRSGRGSMRSWKSVAAEESSGTFRKLAESVTSIAESLKGRRAPHNFAVVLSSLALDHRFLSSGRRANLAAGRDEAVRVDQQGWNVMVEAVQELSETLHVHGTGKLDARSWLADLTECLADSQVRVDAKAVDGVHLALAGAGLPSAAHVFALGWREGLVPKRVREDPLLPDRVKRALNGDGAMFRLASDRVELEREKRERVVRAARQSLVVSWPATGDEGEAMLPSFYMDDLGIGQSQRVTRSVGDTTWPLALGATRGERMARVTVLARHRAANTLGGELPTVRSVLQHITPKERAAYDGERCASQTVKVPVRLRAELAPLAKSMSASQARMLAHCAFEHFGRKRLAVEALLPPALDLRTIGGIIHGVLAASGRAGFTIDGLEELFAAEWERRVGHGRDADPSEPFHRDRVLAELRELVASERQALDGCEARPAHFELAFGMSKEDEEERDPASRVEGIELALPAGAPIPTTILRGSIDRVDVVVRDGKRYGVAIDYKSGKGESYMKDTEELADFQLPIYCEALRAFGIEPVGAVYLGVGSGDRYGVIRDDFADAFGAREAKTIRKPAAEEFAGYMGARVEALREQVVRLAEGEIEIRPRKGDCKYCDLRPVCRIGTFGVGGANGEE